MPVPARAVPACAVRPGAFPPAVRPAPGPPARGLPAGPPPALGSHRGGGGRAGRPVRRRGVQLVATGLAGRRPGHFGCLRGPGQPCRRGHGQRRPAEPPRVTVSRIQTADGSAVTVAVFRGPVQFVLHNGSQDPGRAYAALVPGRPGRHRRRTPPPARRLQWRLPHALPRGRLRAGRPRVCPPAPWPGQPGHRSLGTGPDRGVGRDRARAAGRPSTASGRTCGSW